MHFRKTLAASLLFAYMAFAHSAGGAASYVAVDVGPLTEAWAISNNGRIVGDQFSKLNAFRRAFSTKKNGKAPYVVGSNAGNLFTADVNDNGQVVGYTFADDTRAFITSRNSGKLIDIGTLGGAWAKAAAINTSGQVVGHSINSAGLIRPFLTKADGSEMRELSTLGGTFAYAVGVNEKGQVAGISSMPDGIRLHSFITGANGIGMRDIGDLGGDVNASAINSVGQVVGSASTPSDGHIVSIMTDADGQNIHEVTAAGSPFGHLNAVNSYGQAVGMEIQTTGRYDAVITLDGKTNRYLAEMVDLPPNVSLLNALDINDEGDVVVQASNRHSYILIPAGRFATRSFNASSQ